MCVSLVRQCRIIQHPEQFKLDVYKCRFRIYQVTDVIFGVMFLISAFNVNEILSEIGTPTSTDFWGVAPMVIVGLLFLLDAVLMQWLLALIGRSAMQERLFFCVNVNVATNTVTLLGYFALRVSLILQLRGDVKSGSTAMFIVIALVMLTKFTKVGVMYVFKRWLTFHRPDGQGPLMDRDLAAQLNVREVEVAPSQDRSLEAQLNVRGVEVAEA